MLGTGPGARPPLNVLTSCLSFQNQLDLFLDLFELWCGERHKEKPIQRNGVVSSLDFLFRCTGVSILLLYSDAAGCWLLVLVLVLVLVLLVLVLLLLLLLLVLLLLRLLLPPRSTQQEA